jgi:hypothetical protein
MDKAPGVLIANERVPRRVSAPAPRLRLLIELEPRHRVFVQNLADLLLSRRPPQLRLTSRPARYWNDVFVPTGAPWSAFAESMLLHLLLVVLVVWGQSRVWTSVELFPQQRARHTPITYYPPKPSFRAAESRAPSVRARVKHTQPAAHQPAMRVTPQQTHSIVTPPDIKQATAPPPNLPGSYTVTPTVPFPATSNLRRNASAGNSGVVAPAPQIDQAAVRRMAPPHASAVAPAPELGGSSAQRATNAANADGSRVVPPPPAVQIAGNSGRGERAGSLSARTNVVPPPPSVQGAGGDARLGSLTGAGSQAVPPPPSLQGTSNSGRAGRLTSGSGPNVVPPPPSVQGASNGARDSRSGSIAGSQVVQPPPSVQGAGSGSEHARLGALAGAGSEVVKPPPTVDGAGNTGGARIGSLSANGSQIVPPPPAVEGASNSVGRPGSLGGNGPGDVSQIAPPPSSVIGAGNSGGSTAGKLLEPMDPLTQDASSSTPDANNDSKATFEELPLGLLGVVFVPPGTSYFSNFEVFVAKRRIGKDLQLIKLVYEFLPYQRRLSEYKLNNLPQRVIKLRVVPDPSCDESLGQMIQTFSDATNKATDLPAALRSTDLTAMLPCYRTTASDFEKAMTRGR